MLTEKANAICLLEVLKEYSDAEHILPMREIIAKMQSLYGIKIDRRTVYGAVALLIELGYDVSLYEDNGVGYYLRDRELEPSEVLLLTDAVYSFPFIPARQTEQLVQKLQKQLSVYQRKKYRHLTVARQGRKTENRQIFWNIEQLDEAITRKKKWSWITCTTDMTNGSILRRPTLSAPMRWCTPTNTITLSASPTTIRTRGCTA